MNITSIQQNNPNFGKLYAPRKLMMFETGKVSRKQLLKSESLKECAKKFDVIVRRGEQNGKTETMRNAFIGAGIGMGFSSIFWLVLMEITKDLTGLLLTGCGMTLLFSKFGFAMGIVEAHKAPTFGYLVKGKKDDIETKEHLIVTPEDLDKLPSLSREIEEKRQEQFVEMIAEKYPEDGTFSTKNILSILEDESIKRNYTNDEIFNFNIDINKTSSLLLQFFDIKRTEENAQEYDQITAIIKSTPNINFNQQDNVGISIIENILNMGNSAALDIVKDVEFEYTPYLDKIFNNIQDEEFKKKAQNLKIKFPDAMKVLHTTKSTKRFQEELSFLDSPLCNSKKEAIAIWTDAKKHVSPKDLKEINTVLYKYLPENLRIN